MPCVGPSQGLVERSPEYPEFRTSSGCVGVPFFGQGVVSEVSRGPSPSSSFIRWCAVPINQIWLVGCRSQLNQVFYMLVET